MADYKEPQSIIDVAKNAIEKSKAFMAESEKRTQCFDNFIDLLASNRVLYNKYNAINKFAKTNTTGIDVDDRINAYLLQEAGGIVNEKNVKSAFELVKTECYQKIAERKKASNTKDNTPITIAQSVSRTAPTIYQGNTVLDPLSQRSGVLRNKS